MTLDQPVAASEDETRVTPGYCADPPNQRLVSHRAAGLRAYGTRIEVVCPNRDDHTLNDCERCRWCGGPLVLPTERRSSVSPRRAYCSPNHRLRAFREA